MVNLVNLHFDITCYVHDECADDLGEDLVNWLFELWFNGEDVLDVEFKGYDIVE